MLPVTLLFCSLVVGVPMEVCSIGVFSPRIGNLLTCGHFTEGLVTDSQLFAFTAGKSSFQLAPNNEKGATCLVPNGAALDSAACSDDASQLFTVA